MGVSLGVPDRWKAIPRDDRRVACPESSPNPNLAEPKLIFLVPAKVRVPEETMALQKQSCPNGQPAPVVAGLVVSLMRFVLADISAVSHVAAPTSFQSHCAYYSAQAIAGGIETDYMP